MNVAGSRGRAPARLYAGLTGWPFEATAEMVEGGRDFDSMWICDSEALAAIAQLAP